MKDISSMYGAVYYFFDNNAAILKSNLQYADPCHEITLNVFKLPDQFIIKQAMKLILPTIEFNKLIYISEDHYKKITLESIN